MSLIETWAYIDLRVNRRKYQPGANEYFGSIRAINQQTSAASGMDNIMTTPTNPLNTREFGLSAFVIIISMVTAIALIVTAKIPANYETGLAIFLICFPIAAIISMVFVTQAKVDGTLNKITISLTGAAAVTVAFYLILINFPAKINEPVKPVPLPNNDPDWKSYQEWLNLTGIKKVFSNNAEDEVTRLIGDIYYPANDHPKPDNPRAHVLFAYIAPDKTIAFRHYLADKPGSLARDIYASNFTTLTESNSYQLIYRIDGQSLNLILPNSPSAYSSNSGNWTTVEAAPTDIINILIVTVYNEPGLKDESGDYITTDVPKWVDTSKQTADVELSIASHIPIRSDMLKLWEIKSPNLTTENQVPLSFREWPSPPQPSIEDFTSVKQWLDKLEAHGQNGNLKDVEKPLFGLMKKFMVDGKGNHIPLSEITNERSDFFVNRYSFRLTSQTNPFIVTFLWDKNKTSPQ